MYLAAQSRLRAQGGNEDPFSTKGRKARVSEYLIDPLKVCEIEREESALLVSMDETYCHVNHCKTESWRDPNQMKSNTKRRWGHVTIVHVIDGTAIQSGADHARAHG